MKNIPPELIAKAAGGDMAAFEEIYGRTSGFVYGIALRVLGNRSEAEDVTQEVFIRVYKNLKGFGFRSSLGTWLYRITMNATLNARKRYTRDADRKIEYNDETHGLAKGPPPGDEASRLEREKVVAGLLETLSPEHRACIVLREIEGLSYEEMADALHININTVRSRLKRAREALVASGRREVSSDEL